ncbi:MAG: HlyD family efflux transporter periplasmic adaptor subunit [Sulfuritalea sp.]|nr:HlyD family efflux transporter periplasmic adaptor subunit [Sulfuritalea sp.]
MKKENRGQTPILRVTKSGSVPHFLWLVAATTLAVMANGALAHGDEDHSQDAKKASPAVPVSGAPGAPAALQRLADGSLFVPKSAQRQLGIRTQQARIGDLAATVELNGKIIPDPNTGGRVQATFAGSVMPGPKGMPTAGRKVAKGELLAWLRPVSGAIERGNQKAQLAELEAQLAIADGRVKRFEQLEGAVPQKEIEAARIERDALQKRRAFVAASIDTAEPLLAPAAGVISASHHLVAGQVVDAREVLFEIVDPARLAVEALAYDAGIAATLISASALAEQTALELKFVGAGRQLREQALPLLFQIATSNAAVAVGQPVKVIVRTAHRTKGAAVPRSALTRVGAGETAVWVHTEAERFVARRVRHQSLDAGNVAIADGLHEGDRVVVEGAGLLSQVR